MVVNDPVFIDTSGWLSLLNADDQHHAQAVELFRRLDLKHRGLVTTDWVLAETGNSLARLPGRRTFRAFVDDLAHLSTAQIVTVDQQRFDDALALYDQMHDKTWGLIDCASFVLMKNESYCGGRDARSAF